MKGVQFMLSNLAKISFKALGSKVKPPPKLKYVLKKRNSKLSPLQLTSLILFINLLLSFFLIISVVLFFQDLFLASIIPLITYLNYKVLYPSMVNFYFNELIAEYESGSPEFLEFFSAGITSTGNLPYSIKKVAGANIKKYSSDMKKIYKRIKLYGNLPKEELLKYIENEPLPVKEEIKSLISCLDEEDFENSLKTAVSSARNKIRQKYILHSKNLAFKINFFTTLNFILAISLLLMFSLYNFPPETLLLTALVWLFFSFKVLGVKNFEES